MARRLSKGLGARAPRPPRYQVGEVIAGFRVDGIVPARPEAKVRWAYRLVCRRCGEPYERNQEHVRNIELSGTSTCRRCRYVPQEDAQTAAPPALDAPAALALWRSPPSALGRGFRWGRA